MQIACGPCWHLLLALQQSPIDELGKLPEIGGAVGDANQA